MMKTLILVCLCTFVLVDAGKHGRGQGGGQQGGGQQGGGQQGGGQQGGGQPGQSIELLVDRNIMSLKICHGTYTEKLVMGNSAMENGKFLMTAAMANIVTDSITCPMELAMAKRQAQQNPLGSLLQGLASLGSMGLPDLSTMIAMSTAFLSNLGLPDIPTLIAKAQQVFANMQIPGIPDFATLIAKITQFFMQFLSSIRSRREIKWYPEIIIN